MGLIKVSKLRLVRLVEKSYNEIGLGLFFKNGYSAFMMSMSNLLILTKHYAPETFEM